LYIDNSYNYIDSSYNYIDSSYNYIDSSNNYIDSSAVALLMKFWLVLHVRSFIISPILECVLLQVGSLKHILLSVS